MSGVEVPALGLAGAALGSPAAITAAAGVAVASITPRSLNSQLGGRARRMSQTVGDAVVAAPKLVQKVSMAVIHAQQKWLMDNVEIMMTPRSPTTPAQLVGAHSVLEAADAVVHGRAYLSTQLTAVLVALTGGAFYGYDTLRGPTVKELEAAGVQPGGGGWRNFAIVILVVLCAAAFFLGRLEGKTEVRWQRGDGKKGADGVTKSPARLVRVEKKTR